METEHPDLLIVDAVGAISPAAEEDDVFDVGPSLDDINGCTKLTLSSNRGKAANGCVVSTLLSAVHSCAVRSSCDYEDVEQFIDETHLVLDARLASEAMAASDHSHHFKALDRSGCRLHGLKASGLVR